MIFSHVFACIKHKNHLNPHVCQVLSHPLVDKSSACLGVSPISNPQETKGWCHQLFLWSFFRGASDNVTNLMRKHPQQHLKSPLALLRLKKPTPWNCAEKMDLPLGKKGCISDLESLVKGSTAWNKVAAGFRVVHNFPPHRVGRSVGWFPKLYN